VASLQGRVENEEVEQVADHVTMISHGQVLLSAALSAIKESHRVDGRVPSLDEIFVARVGTAAAEN
jgi:ABC-type Na+ transport system ATPase subunit NatA